MFPGQVSRLLQVLLFQVHFRLPSIQWIFLVHQWKRLQLSQKGLHLLFFYCESFKITTQSFWRESLMSPRASRISCLTSSLLNAAWDPLPSLFSMRNDAPSERLVSLARKRLPFPIIMALVILSSLIASQA